MIGPTSVPAAFEADLGQAMGAVKAAGQPTQTYQALDHVLGLWIGHKLFTVLRYDVAHGIAERVYSSRPDLYPATGSKTFDAAPTMRRVRDSGEIQVAWTEEEMRQAFPDHDRMRAMGCGAIMNVPVLVEGRAVAQFNLSHESGHFLPAHRVLAWTAADRVSPVFAIQAHRPGPAAP